MKKLNIFLCLVLLCLNCAFANENLSINTLPNGQKVIIKEIKDNNIVKIDTWINTGSINENDKETGLSHFLEHLFFKGTTKYPTGTADKILDSKGAIVNAATSKDYTHYYIEIPSKDFDLALEIHSDMLLNPMIPRKELERERPVVIEEISKTKDSPTNRLFDNLYSLIYSKSNHPYRRNVIGTKDVIENVSRAEILSYYDKFYTPDAFTTVIVGDVDAADALKKVEAAFTRDNAKKQTKISYPKVKPLTKIERTSEKMDINKTHIMMGFLAPKFDLPKDNYALDVLSIMLSRGRSSILNQDLKEKKELVLSIDSGNYSQKDSGLFYIYAIVDPNKENIEENVEENVIAEIKKIQKGDFDEKILTKAKNQIKTDTYYARESIDNISDELGYMFTFSSDINYYENYLKNIEKVTKQDIIKAANKYLTTDKYAVSTVQGNTDKKEKKVSNIQKKPLGEYKLLEQNDSTKKVLLDNGLTLITKQKNANSIVAVDIEIVAVDIEIKGSKMVEKKPLTAMLSAALATKGTKNYTNKEFAEFLDENGIKLGLTGGSDTYSILVQTTKDNLDKAFIALDEVINNPLFNESELEKIVTRKKQELKGISDSPSSFVFDEFKALSFPNTIYGQNSKFVLDNIDKVKREDIVEFYKRIINPQNMIVSVVGDVSTNDIADRLNSIININPLGKKFEYKDYSYNKFIPNQNVEKVLSKNEVQSHWLVLGYKTTGALNRKDIATLSIINSILGEGMSSRLFIKLREEKGLAYAVGSSTNTNVLDGNWFAYIGAKPGHEQEAKQDILAEIDTIKKEMVTTKELNENKDKILGKLLLAIETNMDEAQLLSHYGILGKDLCAFEEYKKLIGEINQNDIIEVANKYFSKPYIFTVVKKK